MSFEVVSDAYFPRAQLAAAQADANPWVRYSVFIRAPGVLCGMRNVHAFIREINVTIPADERIRVESLRDGDKYASCEQIALIEGRFQDLVAAETAILGFLTLSGPATGMRAVVDAANGVPVIDMAPRHYYPAVPFSQALTYAAYVGGAQGTSSPEGWVYVLVGCEAAKGLEASVLPSWLSARRSFSLRYGRDGAAYAAWIREAVQACRELADEHQFYLVGTIPHALNAVFGGSIASAEVFAEAWPEERLTVLADYEGRELDVVREAVERFGDKLYGVRLDTHGGRVHQGGSGRYGDIWKKDFSDVTDWSSLKHKFDKYGVIKPHYLVGPGVTLEAYLDTRKLLDELGAEHTKIILSSGFNAEKVRQFRPWIDPERTAFGTGSWAGDMKHHPTADIFELNDGRRDGIWRPCLKVGREYVPSLRLAEIPV